MKYLLGLALALAATTVWAEEEIPEYATGSFNLMRQFNISSVYYIGGFGEIGSVEVKEYQRAAAKPIDPKPKKKE